MPRDLTKSNAHWKKAVTRLPLGVASNFRFWGEDRTIYVKEGRGARITDLDGNRYVDYRLGYGPAILGYADPRVDAAAREGMEVGGVFALSTEREFRVAERIAKMVPAAELVRFSNSGTEAVMAGLGSRAPTPARTTTSSSRAATTASSTPPCGTRRWRSGRSRASPRSSRTARASRSARAASRTSSRPTTSSSSSRPSSALPARSPAC